jgi:hypothetical protein
MPRLRDPRIWLLLGLALSWLVMLVMMWSEFWTMPAPEVLQRERMVRAPTLESLRAHVLQSAGELLVLLLLLWPGRVYVLRLAVSTAGLILYAVLSAPIALTSVQQVHRRWLSGVIIVLLVTMLVVLGRAAVRGLRR